MEVFKILGSIAIDNSKANKAIDETTGNAQKSTSKMSSSFKKMAAVVVSAFSVQKIKEFGAGCVEAFDVQKEAETKLETVMKQRMKSTDKSIQSVKDYASAQQQLGVVGDEVQLSGAQQLATFLNTDEALKELIPAMNNLAVQQNGTNVTSQNMVSIGNMMGKVMQGQTSALTKLGITFDENQEKMLKNGTEQERAATLAQVITDNVGKMNEEMAKTDAGKIQQVKNAYGDLKEQIGAKLEPVIAKLYAWFGKIVQYVSENLDPAIQTVKDKFDMVKTFINDNVIPVIRDNFLPVLSNMKDLFITYIVPALQSAYDNLAPLAQYIIDTAQSAFDAFYGTLKEIPDTLKSMYDWCANNKTALELLAISVGGLTTAIILYNAQMAIKHAGGIKEIIQLGIINGLITAQTIATKAATIATGAFSAVMNFLTSPITLVVLGITALIAIVVLLVKNWDKVKAASKKCWDFIKGVFEKAGDWFFNKVVDPVVKFFTGMWDGIKEKAKDAWEGIKGVFGKVADFFGDIFGKAWQKVKDVFSKGGKIFEGIKDGIANAFKSIVNVLIRGINKVVAFPFDKINALLNKIRSVKIMKFHPFEKLWSENPLPVPQIPELAKGGILRKGQVGLLEGNGAEAVVPLEKNTEWINNVANKINNATSGNGNLEQLLKNLINSVDELNKNMPVYVQKALLSTKFEINNREFARLVKGV